MFVSMTGCIYTFNKNLLRLDKYWTVTWLSHSTVCRWVKLKGVFTKEFKNQFESYCFFSCQHAVE